ncbi:MAG: hypothetical protein FD145_1607 [Candidatus Saganbacteria bacterium]|uniref:CBM11 domain-containing protein n=1 Tax=Candidatus Saganbacteria bacterium TaxID=2575572 RepID=A0A833NZD0_UNCSA|nr:MAG: hypothetical protein FD145_1607 [Candidatus Saganbacteria bacterium]
MKKWIACLIVLTVAVISASAMAGSAPVKKAAYPYLLDNFEDGTYTKDPEWFVFDNIMPSITKEYSLRLSGSANDWYVGGIGTVLGVDVSGYDTFEIDVYGYGETSGKLKIELYDDDNGNADIEVDKSWKPLYDDLWSYETDVNWTGMRHLSIPLKEFKNMGRGNNVFDPNLKNGSGGLVKIQIICVAASQTGSVNYNIDNLEFGVKK